MDPKCIITCQCEPTPKFQRFAICINPQKRIPAPIFSPGGRNWSRDYVVVQIHIQTSVETAPSPVTGPSTQSGSLSANRFFTIYCQFLMSQTFQGQIWSALSLSVKTRRIFTSGSKGTVLGTGITNEKCVPDKFCVRIWSGTLHR